MAHFLIKRSFSVSLLAREVVKTPIQVHGVEGRYASALYTAAVKQKKLETVESDIKRVHALYSTDPKFKEFVLNPTLRPKDKKSSIESIFHALKVSKEIENFITLLAENGRLNKLEAIVNSFESIMRAHRGELFVQVTSAEPLSKKHEDDLKAALHRFAKPNQKLHITMRVDPKILGGLIVNIGDKYVDMSIASKIKKYDQALQFAL
ncbi:hypothetical protein AB6A40_007565 [Gnathostoma spinigerum]|uniref:ATP synthase peripheral stalk subunit OSCP, mitochondrial n=1 Tax=Gnathostoma spinigerum TaxID=75299 RepID=A0ABD6EM45_9BILA